MNDEVLQPNFGDVNLLRLLVAQGNVEAELSEIDEWPGFYSRFDRGVIACAVWRPDAQPLSSSPQTPCGLLAMMDLDMERSQFHACMKALFQLCDDAGTQVRLEMPRCDEEDGGDGDKRSESSAGGPDDPTMTA